MKRFLSVLMLTSMLCLLNPIGVHASGTADTPTTTTVDDTTDTSKDKNTEAEAAEITYDTGDAIDDILRSNRYQGAISSIRVVTDFLDAWFTRIMSITAFFIISSAMLKNAAAGAYCANSKFWDKVDEAHKKSEAYSLATAQQYVTGKQFMNTSPAGIRDFLLGIIPNIKAFTDFEDRDIEPKQYFMKAIPQMIACVIIGIFIYNGYHRDTAAAVGELGAITFERVLTSCDPEVVLNKLTNMTGTPKCATDGRKDPEGLAINKTTHKIYDKLIGTHNDITSAKGKAELMGAIEAYVSTSVPKTYMTDDWEFKSVKGDLTAAAVLTTDQIGDDGTDAYYRTCLDKGLFLQEGVSNIDNGTKYVTIQLSWKKVADKDDGTAASGPTNLVGTPVSLNVTSLLSNGSMKSVNIASTGITGDTTFTCQEDSKVTANLINGIISFNGIPKSGYTFVQGSKQVYITENGEKKKAALTFVFQEGAAEAVTRN